MPYTIPMHITTDACKREEIITKFKHESTQCPREPFSFIVLFLLNPIFRHIVILFGLNGDAMA